MKKAFKFIKNIIENRYLIFQMTKRDVTSQYKKSRLGMFWSLAEPLAFMGILYLIFGIGLRSGRTMEMPFICYLVTGMAVVNMFTIVLGKGTSAIRSHSYLLKKVNFKLIILPGVTVLSEIFNHFLFLIAVIVILFVNSVFPTWYWFQVFYYLFALSFFLLGITLFTSAVGVFTPDLQSIMGVLGRMAFFFTPVFWSFDALPVSIQSWIKLNPLFYIAMGYRESFFYGIPFWHHPIQTIYFWGWTIFMLIVGIFTFNRLRPQFADYI
jgi:ABC-type polysaccharide/polyol phosphate export permease